MDDEDEEYDSTKEDSKGKLLIHMSRIKAIAKQDPDVGGLSHGAVAAISAATQGLLEKLLLGAAEEARAKAQSSSSSSSSRSTTKPKAVEGIVTITPEDIQAYIFNNDEFQFLRGRVEETQASGYLKSYRARVRDVNKGLSKKSLKALVGGALGEGKGHEDEEEEDEDEAVESAAAAAAAATEEGGDGGAGAEAQSGAGAAPAGKAKSMALDENYGDEGY